MNTVNQNFNEKLESEVLEILNSYDKAELYLQIDRSMTGIHNPKFVSLYTRCEVN